MLDTEIIISTFSKYNVKISQNQAENLQNYANLLCNANKTTNLTRILEDGDMLYKNLLDSVMFEKSIEKDTKIIDIGCGAGLPSIPLSIIRDDINVLALDSVGKKVEFVESVKNVLKLNNLTTIHSRIEEIAHKDNYRESFDIVISRAVAPLNILIEYSAPLLKVDGKIYAFKGSNYEEEIKVSKNALEKLNCTIEKIETKYIEEIDATRYLLIIKKTNHTPEKYPRGQNKPRLSPL